MSAAVDVVGAAVAMTSCARLANYASMCLDPSTALARDELFRRTVSTLSSPFLAFVVSATTSKNSLQIFATRFFTASPRHFVEEVPALKCCAAALMDCRGWSAVWPAGGCWAAPGARGAAKNASGGTTLGLNETHRCDALTSVYWSLQGDNTAGIYRSAMTTS